MEADVRIKNYDMILLLSRISTNPKSKFSSSLRLIRLHKGFSSLHKLYKQFHSELFNDFGKSHDTPLHRVMSEDYDDIRVISGVKDSCDKLEYLLDWLPNWYLRRDENYHRHDFDELKRLAKNDLASAKKLIRIIESTGDPVKILEFKLIIRAALDNVRLFHEQLFLNVKGPNSCDFKAVIGKLMLEKGIENVGISEMIVLRNPGGAQLSRWICWDKDTVRKIGYVLTNARHASGIFYDPLEDSVSEYKAWLYVETSETACTLKILNKSERLAAEITELTSAREKPEKRHLRELKITISHADEIINKQHYIATRVVIPFINTY